MLYTIATAGHIDHGKSSLSRALTGMDPDRLPEEKSREMTIELGFVWFNLDDGSEVAIVDVPGHERFVDAMITGVGSIDLVVFIVAADDGWMPQSQEHLEILNLLGTRKGIVVVTKTDLADSDWIHLVKEDIAEKVKGTFLEGADILEFSAVDNSGIDEIKSVITKDLEEIVERHHPNLPRLYVDRVFTMSGHGTVVTGTMRDGAFNTGDEIITSPGQLTGKIKSIQTHKRKREQSQSGSRVALNISGIGYNDFSRGTAITRSSLYSGTRSIAARVTISPNASIRLAHNRTVKLLIGTAKVNARMFVFKDDTFEPGSEGVCEFHFDNEVLARTGDRFIIRLPTPDVLLGGGVVVATDCQKHSRSDKTSRKRYASIDPFDLTELIRSEAIAHKGVRTADLLRSSNFARVYIDEAVSSMKEDGSLVLTNGYVFEAETYKRVAAQITDSIDRFQEKHPSKKGVPKAELIAGASLEPSAFEAVLEKLIADGKLATTLSFVHRPGFAPRLKPEQERLKGDVLAMFSADPKNPPSRKQIETKSFAMKDIVRFMLDSGDIVELSGGLLLLSEDFEKVRSGIVKHIEATGSIAVADVRGLFGYSRKYGVPLLERLDSLGVTKRVGDKRVLVK